jgi:hypothetical protein
MNGALPPLITFMVYIGTLPLYYHFNFQHYENVNAVLQTLTNNFVAQLCSDVTFHLSSCVWSLFGNRNISFCQGHVLVSAIYQDTEHLCVFV